MVIVEQPWYLSLIILIPILIYLCHFWNKRGNRLLLPFGFYASREFRPPFFLMRCVDFVSICCFWLSLVGIIVTISSPVLIERKRVFFSRGMDIMIVLDESPSMAARSDGPSRFDTARRVIRDFVTGRENDAIGLVSFSSEAALIVPPTPDYSFLIHALEGREIMSLGDGTAIGMGLVMAAVHMNSSNAEEKIIILLTDGVNNTGEILPMAAAELAMDMGIRIYTIGIGNAGESFVEFVNPETGDLYRGTILDEPEEDLLREVARKTGGSYFSANSNMSLDAIFEVISTAEIAEKHVMIHVQTRNLYREFVLLILILLMAHLFLHKIVLGSGL